MNYTEFFTVLFPKYNQDKKIGSAGSQHFEGKKKNLSISTGTFIKNKKET